MMQSHTLTTVDNLPLIVRHWACESPTARVQLLHGMAEHCLRYQAFAEFLQQQNIEVIAHNHRGHGERAPLGHFADSHGWDLVLADISTAQSVGNPNVPLFLMGHSMGSFITRSYMASAHESVAAVKGLILSGSNQQHPALFYAAKTVAKLLSIFQGGQHASKVMDYLSFGQFNRPFHPNRTQFDWLCSNESAVAAYIADPLCGNLSSLQFWQDFMGGMCELQSQTGLKAIPKLPILILGGAKDPVGRMGKGLHELQRQLLKVGQPQVELTCYPNGRHEMLHETNRDQVMADIAKFIYAHA